METSSVTVCLFTGTILTRQNTASSVSWSRSSHTISTTGIGSRIMKPTATTESGPLSTHSSAPTHGSKNQQVCRHINVWSKDVCEDSQSLRWGWSCVMATSASDRLIPQVEFTSTFQWNRGQGRGVGRRAHFFSAASFHYRSHFQLIWECYLSVTFRIAYRWIKCSNDPSEVELS